MTTELDICNNALGYLGLEPITDLGDQDSQSARACNRIYAQTRDNYLLSHDWSFALNNEQLVVDSGAPAEGYDRYGYVYEIPLESLKAMRVNDGDDFLSWTFEIRSRPLTTVPWFKKIILTDLENAFLEYVARIEDPDLFDPSFKESLEKKLAFELSWPLTKNAKIQTQMYNLFLLADGMAKQKDASEQLPTLPSKPWVKHRNHSCLRNRRILWPK